MRPQDWHRRYQQQARWTQDLRGHLLPRAGLGHAQRVLEAGCGTGAILTELASQTQAEVHGLDLDGAYLSLAGQEAGDAQLTQGDAHRLPFASGVFDLTLCHYLLLWVAEPVRVIAEMVRVTRPGGWVLALAEPDYGGRIDFPEALIELGVKQEIALRRQGADPRLGRQLRALFSQAGLPDAECGVLGGQWTGTPPNIDINAEWAVLSADLEDLLPEETLGRLQIVDAQAWARGDRVLYVPTFYALGQRPEEE